MIKVLSTVSCVGAKKAKRLKAVKFSYNAWPVGKGLVWSVWINKDNFKTKAGHVTISLLFTTIR